MNRKRYWLIHKLARSRYVPVPKAEMGAHDWSDTNLTTADDERMTLKQAWIDEKREASIRPQQITNPEKLLQ